MRRGGVGSFADSNRPKLARWGVEVAAHYPMGREPRSLPLGFDLYVVWSDMVVSPGRLLKNYRAQAAAQGLDLVVTQRKESAWHRDFPEAGIQKRPPVAGAALADEEVWEPMAIKVVERKEEKAPGKRSQAECLEALDALLAELRADHGLKTLTMDEAGNVEAEVVTVEKLKRSVGGQ